MKIYRLSWYIDHATAFIIDSSCEITKVEVHIMGVLELYDLQDDMINTFEKEVAEEGEEFDYDEDWEFVSIYVSDFMDDHGIFAIVADFQGKQIYVRPNRSNRPNARQMKALRDWAIENECSPEIIFDLVCAKNNERYIKQLAWSNW